MAKYITLTKNISLDDIEKKWIALENESVCFKVFRSSSFQVLAEGFALGALRNLANQGNQISLYCPNEDVESDAFKSNPPTVLQGIFGLELLRLGNQIEGKLNNKLVDPNILAECYWNRVLTNDGLDAPKGNRFYLFSMKYYEVPKTLQGGGNSFPDLKQFFSKINDLVAKRTGEESFGQLTKDLLDAKVFSWLFHIAENAYLHGSRDTAGEKIDGVRGIIFQRLSFKKDDLLENRRDVPPQLREYIERKRQLGVQKFRCITVSDLGVGIQNSIEVTGRFSEEIEKLEFAFKDENSRQNKSDEEKSNYGFGLGNALESSSRLNAFCHIASANIEVFIDFKKDSDLTIEEPKKPSIDKRHIKTYRFTNWKLTNSHAGTSFSIVW